jgi:putative pyruvate formate lyase activating enzyme
LRGTDYPEIARQAIREMHRQVGPLRLDDTGVAQRGLLLRHLVMPGGVTNIEAIMAWVARELSHDTYVNLMAQYHPAGRVRSGEFPEIDVLISEGEFRMALEATRKAGLTRLDPRSACP